MTTNVRGFLIDHQLLAPHEMPSSSGEYRINCPQCGHPNNKCYVNGEGRGINCKHCGFSKSWRAFVRRYEPPTPEEQALEDFTSRAEEYLWADEAMLGYLKDRGLTEQTIKANRLGYWPENAAVYGDPADFSAGLLKDDGVTWFLHDRITIPYTRDGLVETIRGRANPFGGHPVKYLGFKGVDAGLFFPQSVDFTSPVFVTEGEFDALILSQLGYQAVSSPGANQNIARQLTQFSRIFVAFDGDDAGRNGAKSLKGQLPEVHEVILPDGMDISDYVKTFGEDSFAHLVANAKLFVNGKEQIDDRLDLSIEAWEDWAWSNGELLGPKIGWAPRLEKALSGWSRGLFLVGALPNCLEVGTKVLMYDGTTKKVEEVNKGDFVMGPDSGPRKVLETFRGETELHTVYPTYGEPYTVTFNHRLSVKHYGIDSGQSFPMTPQEFYAQPGYIQKKIRGYKVGVDWIEKPVTIDPYFLGAWLGDGFKAGTSIENMEPEIADYLSKYAEHLGLECKKRDHINSKSSCYSIVSSHAGRKNALLTMMQQVNLIGNKHIPFNYLTNSREIRLQVLAGLIDTDGFLDSNGYYEIIQKNEQIANDIVYLVRSLGYFVSIHKVIKVCTNNGVMGNYFRMRINGNLSDIPCKVQRKKYQTPWATDKDLLSSSIVIEPKGWGEYAGFTVDKDNLFMLADFTVTMNSGKSCFFVKSAFEAAKDNPEDTVCVYLSLDDDQEDAISRLVSLHTGVSFEVIRMPRFSFDHPTDLTRRDPAKLEFFTRKLATLKQTNNLVIRDAKYGRSLQYIKRYLAGLRRRYSDKFIVVFIDSLAKVTAEDEPENMSIMNWKAHLATELKYCSTLHDMCIVTPADFRKLNDERRPNNDDLKDASELAYEANAVLLGFNELNVKGGDYERVILKWNDPRFGAEWFPIFELNTTKNKKSLYKGNIRFKFYPPTSEFLEVSEADDREFDRQIREAAQNKGRGTYVNPVGTSFRAEILNPNNQPAYGGSNLGLFS